MLSAFSSEILNGKIFYQEVHKAFTDAQTDQKTPEVLRKTNAASESCLQSLLDKKKPRLAQSLAFFLQVKQILIRCIYLFITTLL